ncbi:3-hydroxyacyl-CoA dehydrogenase family protein [Archangium lipolyticum]|uniref:3-hydroxyacyl-CoA dehydrogenase family protein n=1 Tax=Archangium lipolyticum TaxID=2970465 RepID=UPI002DD6A056|nr:3-hydroxyacyl-CoA dehydrogenase NAD-binding domain-containing protein [Archangium lipolyticum]
MSNGDTTADLKTVGVIGAGTMGIGVAHDLVLHGLSAVLVDVSDAALARAREEIVRLVRFGGLVKATLPKVKVSEALERLRFTTRLADVAGCDFIVENVPEVFATKSAVYTELDAICRPEVCFGVNTSCISITRIAAVTRRPQQIVGMHFMNPVYLKSAVEVIRGFHTTQATLDRASALLAALGKSAIVVNDLPGFVANRISHLMMNEAAFLVQDQVADARAIDEIFKQCYGHAMGPLETADLIGLDTVVSSIDVLYESYQDPKFRCSPLLRKMVAAGKLGRKSGEGFHKY